MTVGELLAEATKELAAAAVSSARLDVLIMLEDLLQKDRSHVLAHPELLLTRPQLNILSTSIAQRKAHYPLAYIRGRAAFYGRDFVVTTDTLVPRPESEAMITLLTELRLSAPVIADIGTGSGCLGITAALEIPGADVYVYDTSSEALKVTTKNTRRHNVRVHRAQQDLLHSDNRHYNVILANLPYIPDSYPVNRAATFEPDEALFSGPDGLDHYRELWKQLAGRLYSLRADHVIVEALSMQHIAIKDIAETHGYRLQRTLGLAQCYSLDEQT